MNLWKIIAFIGAGLALPAFAAVVPATSVPTVPTVATPEQALLQLEEQAKDSQLVPVAVTNRPSWLSSITLGATMERGNENMVLASGKLQMKRRSDSNEVSVGLDGMYGEDNSVKNSETLHGFGQVNHFFTQRFYGFVRLDGLYDGMQDLDYRFTASPGVGYYLLRQTNFALAVEAGPSMVTQRQAAEDEIYCGARLAVRTEYKLNAITRFWQTTELISQVDEPDNTFFNVEVGVEATFAKNLGLQIYLQDDYDNQAAEGYKNNDVHLVSGVSYKF
jgi:putative salt-induced outer membrane protein YdiY